MQIEQKEFIGVPFLSDACILQPISKEVKSRAMRNELDQIVFLFGQWAVTTYGLESLDDYYQVSKERLWETDWESHMSGKNWVNINEFRQALKAARRFYGSIQ